MTIPALVFGFMLSSLYGALFHLWRGGGAGRLLLDLTLAWLGFWTGNLLAAQVGLALLKVGPLYVGPASLLAALFLFLGHWLAQIPAKPV